MGRKQQKKDETVLDEPCWFCQKVVKLRNGGMAKHLLHCWERQTSEQADQLINSQPHLSSSQLTNTHTNSQSNHDKAVTCLTANEHEDQDDEAIDFPTPNDCPILDDTPLFDTQSSADSSQNMNTISSTQPNHHNNHLINNNQQSNDIAIRLLNRIDVANTLAGEDNNQSPINTNIDKSSDHSLNLLDMLGTTIDLPNNFKEKPVELDSNLVA